MKLGVSMYSYVRAVQAGRLDLPGFVREAKAIGADGVELLDFFYRDVASDRAAALDALAETGLTCGVFSVAQNFAKPDPDERLAQGAKISFGIAEAGHFGAKTVRVFAGDTAEGIAFDDAFAWIVEGLSHAADEARDAGVRLGLENHGKLAGRGDQVRRIIEEVRQRTGHDALGANPDTGNFLLVGQRGEDGVAEVADLATMVHFKDFAPSPEGHYSALDGTRFRGTVIGEGAVDLAACVRHLREAGFDGWLNLEYEGEGDPMVEVAQSLQNARSILGSN